MLWSSAEKLQFHSCHAWWSTTGCQWFKLAHQHRLVGNIHHFTNRIFYDREILCQKARYLDLDAGCKWMVAKGQEIQFGKSQEHCLLEIPESKETSVGYSWLLHERRCYTFCRLGTNANEQNPNNVHWSWHCIRPRLRLFNPAGCTRETEYISEISRRVDRFLEGIGWENPPRFSPSMLEVARIRGYDLCRSCAGGSFLPEPLDIKTHIRHFLDICTSLLQL